MTTAHLAGLTPDQVRRKSLISGTVGAIIEWYEYRDHLCPPGKRLART